jgi:hypothetical protein
MISSLYHVSEGDKQKSDELNGTFSDNSGCLLQLVDKKKRLVASNLPFCLMEPNMLLKNRQYTATSPERLTSERGFRPLYHEDTVNHCPGCGKTHWHIGRTTAECAFCDTALPLALSSSRPVEPMFWFRGSGTAMATA